MTFYGVVFLAYLFPVLANLIYFSYVTYKNCRDDAATLSHSPDYYHPTDKVGDILYRVLITFFPVVNILFLLFEAIPLTFPKFVKTIESILEYPLVPKK